MTARRDTFKEVELSIFTALKDDMNISITYADEHSIQFKSGSDRLYQLRIEMSRFILSDAERIHSADIMQFDSIVDAVRVIQNHLI